MQARIGMALLTALWLSGCFEADNEHKTSVNMLTALPKEMVSSDRSKQAFSHPFDGMDNTATDRFVLGRSFFHIPWVQAPSATTARDGLGPLFSANTCVNCHTRNGAGVAVDAAGRMQRSLLLRLAKDVGGDPVYGVQLSMNGTHDTPYEGVSRVTYSEKPGRYPDGTPYTLRAPVYSVTQLQYGPLDPGTLLSPRIAPALIGMGLIEAIPEAAILAAVDVEDADNDGISGKANRVLDPDRNITVAGRFTWKAAAPSIRFQSANAASNDMGLTSPLFPRETCTPVQTACLKAPKGRHAYDLPGQRLDAIAYYVTHLKVPKPRPGAEDAAAKKLFARLSCDRCHTPSFTTQKGRKIAPFSDFLLHDMGPALADGAMDHGAEGSEWRTAPLWGIGLYQTVSGEANYLHDGRARSIEEAILWHGGEAQAARTAFMALDTVERAMLINYVGAL